MGFPPLNNFAKHFINLCLNSYVASCTYWVSPTDASLVTVVDYYSVSPSYYWRVTGHYVVYESISVPDIEFPVPAVIFVASQLTIIKYTVVSSKC